MQKIILLPGIFGTEMLRAGDGFKLWPPIGETASIDVETRARQLIDPSTTAGKILEGIPLFPLLDLPEYSPVTDFLDELPGTELVRFPYDWRVDLRKTAEVLAAQLSLTEGPIVIVAHSMGGLVCRYLLECGKFDQTPWFARVRQLICIAVPHLGAPLSVFRILGMEGMSGLIFPGWAMGILASVPDVFPGGHQLLPPSSVACVRYANGSTTNAATAFPAIARAGVSAASGLHAVLDRFRRPQHILYRVIYGHGHIDGAGQRDTTVGITLDDRGRVGHLMGDGDGTVPFWSALPLGPAGFIDDQFGVVGEHVGMLSSPAVLQRIEDWASPRMV